MYIQLLPIFVALITTFIAIALLRPFAQSINLIDKPSGRKLHTGSIPLIGGIAMFFGMLASILVLSLNLNDFNYFNYFLLTSLVLVSIGVLDDYQEMSVSIRIIFQFLAAIIIISGGN